MPTLAIKYDDAEQSVNVPLRSSLKEVCEENDIGPSFGCGQGACGSCEIKVHNNALGLNPPTEEEIHFLGVEALQENVRLACQCVIEGDCTIEVL